MRSLIAIAVVAASCAACGSGETVLIVDGVGPSTPYSGPMSAGAAVAALECDGRRPFIRNRGRYGDGLATVQSSPQDAFVNYVEKSGIGYTVPLAGYRVERKDKGHALISYDVGERTKVAVLVADGIRDFDDHTGWGVVAWAQCDPSEFPAAVTDALNIGVWERAGGRRLPVSKVRSFQGAEHCSWQDITFLLIGPDEEHADWYVRDTTGQFSDLLHGRSEARAVRSPDATFTGWSRNGRQLWIDHADKSAYLVDADRPMDVERWPAAKKPIWCA